MKGQGQPFATPFPPPPISSLSIRQSASRSRLDSIRHYFFLFLFFNLAASERSGLVIDVAVSKPEMEKPPPLEPFSPVPTL